MKKAYSIIAALSISLFIYLFYRSEKTVVNELAIFVMSLNTYHSLKSTIRHVIPLPSAVIYSLPGGLWLFCVTILSKTFYLKIKDYKVQVAVILLLFAIGLEFCQLSHLTQGRFDLWDIACYAIFWLLAQHVFPSQSPFQNILSPITLQGFICLICFLSVYLAHVNL